MDTLPAGMTKEEFQAQIMFALFLRNSQDCARARTLELITNDCICRANPEWYNYAETANRLISDIVVAIHPMNQEQSPQLDSSS